MTLTTDKARTIAEAHCAAWTAADPDAVANRYADPPWMSMNHGEPMTSRAEISQMAAAFMADFPGLVLTCDHVLAAGSHMIYAWTFTGTHAATGRKVRFSGWEEWDLNDAGQVTRSLGWFDAEDYERQITPEP